MGTHAVADERYIVVTVECSRCKTRQKVHVNSQAGVLSMHGGQIVLCIKCDNAFKVTVSDRIIRGPFPA
jgi:hypothetical protein